MANAKIVEIKFDGNIDNISKTQLAQWMMDRKKYVYNEDIKTKIGDIELDTVNCENEEDFLNKYASVLDSLKKEEKADTAESISSMNTINSSTMEANPNISTNTNVDVNADVDTLNATLNGLLQKQKTQQKMLTVLELIKEGKVKYQFQKTKDSSQKAVDKFQKTTGSFKQRKEKIKQEIDDLNKAIVHNDLTNLQEAEKAVERLNNFIINENMKNNSAMPFYYKALETHTPEDIEKAREAINQLDDAHMYKNSLQNAIQALATEYSKEIQIYQLNNEYKKLEQEEENVRVEAAKLDADIRQSLEQINQQVQEINNQLQEKQKDDLGNAEKAVERLNSFIVDENTKNNSAMPFYYKALETRDPEDIEKAREAINQLDDSHMYKKKLQDVINILTPNYAIQTETPQNTVNIMPKPKNIENLPGSSSPTAMLPKQPLEENYYDRLENAAKEGPIFHDTEFNFDLIPVDEKPHIIKKITKAPSKLIKKIRQSKLAKKINKVLDFFAQHKKAAAIATGLLLAAGITAGAVSNSSSKDEQVTNNPVEPTIETAQDEVEKSQETTDNITKAASNINVTIEEEEKTEDQTFEDNLKETLNNILDGNAAVYTSANDAITNTDSKMPNETQLENSWQNSQPGAFYNVENNFAQMLSEEEAKNYWQDGGNVVVRMDNENGPVGFVPLEQQEDAASKSM